MKHFASRKPQVPTGFIPGRHPKGTHTPPFLRQLTGFCILLVKPKREIRQKSLRNQRTESERRAASLEQMLRASLPEAAAVLSRRLTCSFQTEAGSAAVPGGPRVSRSRTLCCAAQSLGSTEVSVRVRLPRRRESLQGVRSGSHTGQRFQNQERPAGVCFYCFLL